jgi:uncharacterized small protein (DUF1192 family)
MPNFDEIKQKVGETAERVAGSAVQFAKFAGEKAAIGAKFAHLNASILGEKEIARRAYTRIGKKYVELFGDAPAEELLEIVETVKQSQQRIEVLREEIEKLKAESGGSDYTVVDEDTKDDTEDDA